MGVVNPPSSVLFGANNVSNGLQTGILASNGQLLTYNGPKNYISNSSFANQLTTGYSLGITGTLTNGIPTGSPTFGSGASGNLSIAIVSSGQLAGVSSLSYVSSAATTAGNMLASDPFTIDIADQAKPMSISIAYKPQSGASNANFSGTSSSSFAVAVYDVTNSAWIIPQQPFAFIQSGNVGLAQGSFQTSSNGTSYRLVVYNANATSGAITMYFDDFFLGPQAIASSSSIVSWNGSQSSQAVTANVTDIAFTTTKDSSAAWNGTQFVVPVSGDYAVMGSLTGNTTISVQVYVNGSLYVSSFLIGGTGSTNPMSGAMLVTGRKPGDTISIRSAQSATLSQGNLGIFLIGSQPGAGAGGVVAARAHVSSGVSTTALNPVNYDTVDFDTSGAITTGATTWQFKCPVSGYYHVEANGFFGAQGNLLAIYKNAAIDSTISTANVSNVSGIFGAAIVKCNAGDLLDVRPTSTGTPTAIAASPVTLANCNYVSIFLIQGTQASSSGLPNVNARYFASATAISGTLATVAWTTKDFDSANAMASGVYTVPLTGKYQINAALLVAGTFALNNSTILEIQKNGTVVSRDTTFSFASMTDSKTNISDIISCLAGDTIRVQVSSGATIPTIVSSNFDNYFSIALVGM